MMESSTRKKNTMIIAGMVVLTILAFLLINFFSGPGTNPDEGAGPSKQDLIAEIEELESSIVELEVVFTQLNFDQDMKTSLLEEKRDEINAYTKKIEELEAKLAAAERRGDVDQATINKLKNQIAEAKEKLINIDENFSRQEVEFLYMENKKLAAAFDSLQPLKPDSLQQLIGDLQADNEQLQRMLKDCGSGSSSATLTERGTELDQAEVEAAAKEILAKREYAFVLTNRKKRKDETISSSSYKGNDLETLLVTYKVTANNFTSFFNGSEMYLVVTDANDKYITSGTTVGVSKECDNKPCIAVMDAVYGSGTGVTFEIQEPESKWGNLSVLKMQVFFQGELVGKKILSLN